MRFSRSIAACFVASLLAAGVASPASADTARGPCNPTTLTCAVGSSALSGTIKQKLATEIDSGWMDKGLVKIRTRFTIDPVKGEPLLAVDMPKGAVVEASWPEKGMLSLRPLTSEGATGTMNVRYTLTPSLDADIYGTTVAYNATQLLAKIPGSQFNYDAKATGTLLPWGFAGGQASAPAPALASSTIFSLSFEDLGIDPGTAEGSLAIQAAAKPTFKYKTKEVQLDSASVSTADGSAKIPVGDSDFVDVSASVVGELALEGILDMRPVVTVDSAYGVPTFGLVKYSFSAVSKAFGGAPTPVQFERTTIHIPLPNVKVPTTPFNIGSAKGGAKVEKSVTIDSTGELGALLEITSSDPQFVVPSGQVRVDPKSKYSLAILFQPASDGPASATITVKSNDPDSPEQTFRVAANGASLEPDAEDFESPAGKKKSEADAPEASDGCSFTGARSHTGAPVFALALGLGLALASRRRRA